MVSWVPPGHWPKAQRKAYARSVEFLRSIVNDSPQLTLRENMQSLPEVTVQGLSRRWYRVNTHAQYSRISSTSTANTVKSGKFTGN